MTPLSKEVLEIVLYIIAGLGALGAGVGLGLRGKAAPTPALPAAAPADPTLGADASQRLHTIGPPCDQHPVMVSNCKALHARITEAKTTAESRVAEAKTLAADAIKDAKAEAKEQGEAIQGLAKEFAEFKGAVMGALVSMQKDVRLLLREKGLGHGE